MTKNGMIPSPFLPKFCLPGVVLAFAIWLALCDHHVVPGHASADNPGCSSSAADAYFLAPTTFRFRRRMSSWPLVLGHKLPGDFWDRVLLAILRWAKPVEVFF